MQLPAVSLCSPAPSPNPYFFFAWLRFSLTGIASPPLNRARLCLRPVASSLNCFWSWQGYSPLFHRAPPVPLLPHRRPETHIGRPGVSSLHTGAPVASLRDVLWVALPNLWRLKEVSGKLLSLQFSSLWHLPRTPQRILMTPGWKRCSFSSESVSAPLV